MTNAGQVLQEFFTQTKRKKRIETATATETETEHVSHEFVNSNAETIYLKP